MISVIVALCVYKIVGKYIEELYFRAFPFKSLRTRVTSLQSALVDEMRRAEEARRQAEKAIEQAQALRWRVFELEREIAKRKNDSSGSTEAA